jgi:hypothetical protein
VMENGRMLHWAENEQMVITHINQRGNALTVIDRNAEWGGLEAAKKSAISTFRAEQTNFGWLKKA